MYLRQPISKASIYEISRYGFNFTQFANYKFAYFEIEVLD